MKHLLLVVIAMGFNAAAHAEFSLAHNGKAVICSGDDNQSFVLNKKRTTIKYTVEGETLGAREIINTDTDGHSFVAYTTDEGTLTLSDQGDTFQFGEEDQAWGVKCR